MTTTSATTITTMVAIQKTVFEQAETLAKQLNLTQDHLFESALEHFIEYHQEATRPDTKTGTLSGAERTIINQGDIYWVQLKEPDNVEPNDIEPDEAAPVVEQGIPHPYVIIQENLFNHSRIHTVVACALTSNIRRVSNTPGNVLLDAGEANLPKQSVVEVSKVSTVDKAHLGEYIGSLTEQRVHEILAGIRFLQNSFFAR
jgi:mRNA interferase MazF